MFDYLKVNKEYEKVTKKMIAANQKLYLSVFDTPSGKDVLENLAKRCYVKTSTYDDNPQRMAFREGRRSIFVYIGTILGRDLQDIMEDLTK